MTQLTILIITVILSFALLIFIFEIALQKRQADINLLQKELFDLENKYRLSLKSNILITKDNEYLISQIKKEKTSEFHEIDKSNMAKIIASLITQL